MSSAERSRRSRALARAGKRVLRVAVDEVGIEALLAEAGYLPPNGTDDREALRQALERMLGDLELRPCPHATRCNAPFRFGA